MPATENQVKNVTAPISEASAPKQAVDFGNGKYSAVATILFTQSQFFLGLTEIQATKLGKAYASDLGRLNVTIDKVGIGKANKDGYVTIRESGKTTKVKFTTAMRLASIIKILGEAYDMGVHRFGNVELDPELAEWLNS